MNVVRGWRATAACLCLALAGCTTTVPPEERSVILVTFDTTRADRLGVYGNGDGLSPNVDRIAAEGVVFEEAIAQVPLTLPSHATLFTARYPASHGVRHNGIYRLRESETTLAEWLRDRGFATAGFAAAFVMNRGFGAEQGFDVYDDVPGNRFEGARDQIYEAQRTAEAVNERVFRWLRARPERERFFLWVHYYDPHDPYEPPESPDRALRGTGYDREISYMDSCFGDLVRELDRKGVLDRSVLVLAGDHGESLGQHGEMRHGIFLYEPSMHVPLIVRAPGLVPAGKRVPGPVELADVAPTILDLIGAPPLPAAQGRSLVPRIDGSDDGRAALAHAESLSPRLEFGWAELRMVRDGRFKYVEAPVPELYDLRRDPGEEQNLAPLEPERTAELSGALARWTAATTDASAETEAARSLDPDEEARLRSLGYLGGDYFKSGGEGGLTDPKQGIAELRRLGAARDLLTQGDAAGALAGASEVLASNPSNHLARETKALALIDLGRLAEAEDEALGALAAAGTDPFASAVLTQKARGLLASVLALRGKRVEAEDQYRRILRDDPTSEAAAVDLARLLLEQGRRDEAAALVEDVLRKDPANGMALAARFLIESAEGRNADALKTAAALADARAGDVQVLNRAGRRLQDAGDFARAAACYEVALEQMRELDPALLGRLGIARLSAGDPEGAEKAFGAAAALTPSDPRPQHYLGVIRLGRGDEAGAREAFDRAMALDPGFTAPLVHLARWLGRQGRMDEARSALAAAEARRPGDPAVAAAAEELRGADSR
jgi:arylsulfatase A-like enzyme/tetratricopeptide (TPR) repeat protein